MLESAEQLWQKGGLTMTMMNCVCVMMTALTAFVCMEQQ